MTERDREAPGGCVGHQVQLDNGWRVIEYGSEYVLIPGRVDRAYSWPCTPLPEHELTGPLGDQIQDRIDTAFAAEGRS